ncbi:DUF6247 family protein [Frankia sp. Cas4]|uniref:DUF6247 family protein n=1 Tax=Frankia sp. Cas4 TaxID=3073927 RepID=UPI002AD4ED46|nr:DUF6247 family protein [Frankia sp. Cas4]
MSEAGVRVDARSAHVRRVDKNPAAIRAALPADLQPAFDTDFRTALATVADTLDMAPLDRVLRVWWTEALLCLNPEVQTEIDDTRWRIAAGDPTVFGATTTYPYARQRSCSALPLPLCCH